ncbi:methyltransferase domain-containing protein [Luteimonas marina]|uniref:Methyltransferase domain-containing protein n=1 Tax=Luteimonas marina TaxID=488485 RepID=A0A5C5TSJ2_9GAMM|nr:methyltransferase domain-containing protein [Luteimonas marina]TWT17251.1 methyltransferase domain-containing protein [Luteimonas marina]
MKWYVKSVIQNAVAALPDTLSHRVYYGLQRRFGGLRDIDVEDKLRQGIEVAATAVGEGLPVRGARVLEVGTGRRLNLPLSLWLQGAASVTTVDLNPYLRPELVEEDLRQIRDERERVERLFGDRLDQDRLRRLLLLADDFDLQRVLDTCSIRYLAPGDATRLADLADGSIDLHVSYEVFEHIPGPVLEEILHEGSRVISERGLLVHYVDFSDHFSHSDASIGPVHFLRFDEPTFRRIAGNRYMYMNRLRLDDFLALYARADQALLRQVSAPDADVERQLRDADVPLAPPFDLKSADVLSTLNAWLVSRPAQRTDA